MSSPRPASRPKALLPSALPHDHEGASSSPPRRSRPAAAGAASTTTAATTAPSKTQAPQRPSSSSTTHTVQSRAMQSATATGANYSQAALSGGDEQYSSAPILIEESSPYPHFQPFFTLVDDGSDSGHPSIHPSVNYIFDDDDQEPITGAAIRIDSSSSHHSKAPKRPPDPAATGAGSGNGGSASRRRSVQGGGGIVSSGTATTAATAPEVIERCVLITLGPDGRSIESAVSLTPDWHVDSAELSAAPTLDGDSGLTGTSPGAAAAAAVAPRPSEEDSTAGASTGAGTAGLGDVVHPIVPEGPLMLRIRGSEVPAAIGQEEALDMGLDGLCETFRERLAELKKVVDAAAAAEPLAAEDEGEEWGVEGKGNGRG